MDPSSVTITFPASADYLRLARLAAADAGSRAGFDFEEIDDLRIAVSELCIVLTGAGATIELAFSHDADVLTVTGSAAIAAEIELGELSRAIVSAVVDDYELTSLDGVGHFRVRKRARGGA